LVIKNEANSKEGQIRWNDAGDIHDGAWRNGLREGHGRMTTTKASAGDTFEG
jgi:hypothetical protein